MDGEGRETVHAHVARQVVAPALGLGEDDDLPLDADLADEVGQALTLFVRVDHLGTGGLFVGDDEGMLLQMLTNVFVSIKILAVAEEMIIGIAEDVLYDVGGKLPEEKMTRTESRETRSAILDGLMCTETHQHRNTMLLIRLSPKNSCLDVLGEGDHALVGGTKVGPHRQEELHLGTDLDVDGVFLKKILTSTCWVMLLLAVRSWEPIWMWTGSSLHRSRARDCTERGHVADHRSVCLSGRI